MAKGKRRNINKGSKGANPQRGPNQPSNHLPKLIRPRATTHSDTVFSIFELLELILRHIDLRAPLVSAQRVSTHWHAVITASPRLQRRPFFLPNPDTPAPDPSALLLPIPKTRLNLNPLLPSAFPCLFDLRLIPHRKPCAVKRLLLPPACGFVMA